MLRQEFPKCEFELERKGGDRVGGFLIWNGFEGLEQIDRQRKVSAVLKQKLSVAERQHVSALLTMTPDEMEFARQA